MSSATPTDVAKVRGIVRNLPEMKNKHAYGESGGPSDALSDRQMRLDNFWRYYRCMNYDTLTTDWNGQQITSHIEKDVIGQSGVIPPGFYDAGQTLPLKFRKPSVPYYLVKVIVARFTGLLFSKKRHPKVTCDDPDTQDWLEGFADATRLWSQAIQMRNYGGAQGTAVLGFKFVHGKPYVEVHDARWCTPEFSDRALMTVSKMEKRYQFKEDVRNNDGEWEEKWFWYRRIITDEEDVIWPKVPVEDEKGDRGEPKWEKERFKCEVHNFGECPIIWVQNMPVEDDLDGDPDAYGIYDIVESIDQLLSQATRGTIANCFGAETEFVTKHGVRCFADCMVGQEMDVRTHTGEWAIATVHEYGEQQLNQIVLQRGSSGAPIHVRATPGHRWLLEDGETTEVLAVGDRLMAAPATFREFEWETAQMDDRVAWIQGFVWGDGSRMAQGSRLRLCGEKRSYVGRFMERGYNVTYPPHAKGDPCVCLPNIPKALPQNCANASVMRAFVRGFVDADGSKGNKESSRWRCIQVTGEESVQFVRRFFPAAGLYITKETDLSDEITNYGPRGAITIRFTLNENASQHFNSAFRVVSIEPDEVETVWCLQVPSAHSFTLPCGVVTRNCDPTVGIASDAEFDNIKKGSGFALQVEKGATVQYLEMAGTGIERAMLLADQLEDKALTIARCVLDRKDAGATARTATEIERTYASMIEQADIYREQYGELGIKSLLEMVLRVARKLNAATMEEQDDGTHRIMRTVITLPKRRVKDADIDPVVQGQKTPFGSPKTPFGSSKLSRTPNKKLPPQYEERVLGEGIEIKLKWPDYFTPSLESIQMAVQAAGQARSVYNIVDDRNAVEFIAPYLGVEDVDDVLERIKTQAKVDAPGGDVGNMINSLTAPK